jgi:hypothetical protein
MGRLFERLLNIDMGEVQRRTDEGIACNRPVVFAKSISKKLASSYAQKDMFI